MSKSDGCYRGEEVKNKITSEFYEQLKGRRHTIVMPLDEFVI